MRGTDGGRWRVANGVMAVLFGASALAQYNDPDPWTWVALYAGAAAACLVVDRLALGWAAAAAVGVVALAWSAQLAPAALPGLRLADLFGEMQAATPSVELGREMLGLAIVAAWMALQTLRTLRRRSA